MHCSAASCTSIVASCLAHYVKEAKLLGLYMSIESNQGPTLKSTLKSNFCTHHIC